MRGRRVCSSIFGLFPPLFFFCLSVRGWSSRAVREAKARSMTRTKHQQLQQQQQLQHQHQHQQRRRLKRVVAYARIRPSSKESPQSAKTEKIRGEEEEEEEEERDDDDDDDDDLHKEEGEKKTRASLTDPRVVEPARGRFRVDHAF